MVEQSRNCPDKAEVFYESKGDLCYSVVSVNVIAKKNSMLEINNFIIMGKDVAIFNTPNNEQYEIKYIEGVGLKTRRLN